MALHIRSGGDPPYLAATRKGPKQGEPLTRTPVCREGLKRRRQSACVAPLRISACLENDGLLRRRRGAWCAIAMTPIPEYYPAEGVFRADHLRPALDAVVRGGNDTDSVAAIAGGLLGVAHGASAVPAG